MKSDIQPLVHLVTRVSEIDGIVELIEVQVVIQRTTASKLVVSKAEPANTEASVKPISYSNAFTTKLSDANKRGLEQLAYWSNGARASKVYLINQALAQYLAQYQESQWAIPVDKSDDR